MGQKKLSIWGATGSIGQQTLDVVSRFKDRFEIITLTTHRNVGLIMESAKRFHPKTVVITGNVEIDQWKHELEKFGIEVLTGKEGLLEAAGRGEEELVVNALVGGVGLEATMECLKAGSSIALANKEVLVMAGGIVTAEINQRGLDLLPIDSEHSALFQCLQGEEKRRIRRILLTASGGPFLNKNRSEMGKITIEEALSHPNWSMGKKVTIDSSTLMNKGLEVIEAHWLFGIDSTKIEVVVHPQSIIHSMVEFVDGSIKAQLGIPDMRIPISYALTYPDRWPGDYGWINFEALQRLEFSPPDMDKFKSLKLAYAVLEMGGTAPAVLNAADEIAVDLFLSGRIGFLQIPEVIDAVLQRHEITHHPDIRDILRADQWARETVMNDIVQNF